MPFFDENDEVTRTLAALYVHVHALAQSEPEQQMAIYAIVRALVADLQDYAEREGVPGKGNVQTYIGELLWSCRSIVGLSEGNGKSIDTHVTWALAAIQKLGSVHAFGVSRADRT